MRVLLLILVACTCLSFRCAAAGNAHVVGTWVYVEKWEPTRADVQPGRYTSPALVLRFCPNGRFVMLKCMLYRQRRESTQIGPDDGLQIYQGIWFPARNGATVSYHLADSEIIFAGYQSARRREISRSVILAGDVLRMPAVRLFLPGVRDFPARFQRKAQLPAPLQEKFIDCSELSASER